MQAMPFGDPPWGRISRAWTALKSNLGALWAPRESRARTPQARPGKEFGLRQAFGLISPIARLYIYIVRTYYLSSGRVQEVLTTARAYFLKRGGIEKMLRGANYYEVGAPRG